MFIEEHAAKQLLTQYDIPIPAGYAVTSAPAAGHASTKIGGPVMIKAQIPAGKRGLVGGILAAEGPTWAAQQAEQLLGADLNGYEVTQLLVEAQVTIAQELYVAITLDPTRGGPMLMYSAAGSMAIESLHAQAPEQIHLLPIDISAGLTRCDLEAAGWSLPPALIPVLLNLYRLYRQLDAQLVEINPLALTPEGQAIALDAKLVIDPSALYRQTDLPNPPARGTALELAGQAQGFLFIELDGDVGILANGAGLTMSTMDTVSHYGGHPANFMEVGGDAYRRARPALELVLGNPKVRSLLINLCGAYARTDTIVEGVLAAWQELQPQIPVSFCIHGTGELRAQQLVRDQLGIEPYDLMDDAVQAAIEAAQGKRFKPARSSPAAQAFSGPALISSNEMPGRGRRVLVQGITGQEGAYWTGRMVAGGTQVLAGVTPGKGGQMVAGIPVYDRVAEAHSAHALDLSVLFVPPRFARDAAIECIQAGIPEVMVLTEHIPVQDVMQIMAAAKTHCTRVFGPNCPGLVFPGHDFIGVMPGWADNMFQPGPIGVISRSGSLGALICLQLVQIGLGQTAFYGIGGDPVVGTSFRDVLQVLEADPATQAVAMLGEIGGLLEAVAAAYIAEMMTPVVAFIAGGSAPPGKRMGHAGAMVAQGKDTAAAKKDLRRAAGAVVVETPAEVSRRIKDLL